MAEFDAAKQEDLRQIAEAELVAEPEEHTSAMTSEGYLARLRSSALRSLNCLPQSRHRNRR